MRALGYTAATRFLRGYIRRGNAGTRLAFSQLSPVMYGLRMATR